MSKKILIGLTLMLSSIVYGQSEYLSGEIAYDAKVKMEDNEIIWSYTLDFWNSEANTLGLFNTTDLDTFILILEEDLDWIEGQTKDVLIYIHGYMGGNDFNHRWTKKELVKHYINEDTGVDALIAIQWPGNNPAYFASKDNIQSVDQAIAKWLIALKSDLASKYGENNISLHVINHSLGNELFKSVVTHMPDQKGPFFGQLVLAAPDLDTTVFEQDKALTRLEVLAERVTVYYNKNDMTLAISSKLNKKGRLGLDGPSQATPYYPWLYFVDTSEISDEKFLPMKLTGHSAYRASPICISDMKSVFKGERGSNKRKSGEEAGCYMLKQ